MTVHNVRILISWITVALESSPKNIKISSESKGNGNGECQLKHNLDDSDFCPKHRARWSRASGTWRSTSEGFTLKYIIGRALRTWVHFEWRGCGMSVMRCPLGPLRANTFESQKPAHVKVTKLDLNLIEYRVFAFYCCSEKHVMNPPLIPPHKDVPN